MSHATHAVSAMVRAAGAVVLVDVFATSALRSWQFVALFLGLCLGENAAAGGPPALTAGERVLVHGAAGVAAVAVLIPGVVLGWHLVRPRHLGPRGAAD